MAHNERNERGVPVAKVIHNLGREDLLDRDALTRLVRSIQRFLGGEDGLRAGVPHGFEFVRAPECGGPHVVGELWAQLGIGKAIGRVAGAGRGRSGVERAIFTMVCQRCLEPASKLEATHWVGAPTTEARKLSGSSGRSTWKLSAQHCPCSGSSSPSRRFAQQ